MDYSIEIGPVGFLPLLSAGASLFVLAYVYGQRRSTPLNRSYLLYSLTLVSSSLCEFIIRLPIPEVMRTNLIGLAGMNLFFQGILFLNFTYSLLNKKRKLLFWSLALVSSVSAVLSPFFDVGTAVVFPGYRYPIAVPFYSKCLSFMLITCFIPGVYATVLCYLKMKTTDDRSLYMQLRYIVAAAVVPMVYTLALFSIAGGLFGVSSFFQYSSLGMLISTILIYIAVSRYYFLSVDVRQLEGSFVKLFENIKEAVVFFDPFGNPIMANSSAETLFGINGKMLKREMINSRIPEYEWNKTYCGVMHSFQEKGKERYLILSQSSVRDNDQSLGRILLVHDITDQKIAERELQRARNIQALGNLAGGIAHDFNNLLFSLSTSIALARQYCSEKSEMHEILSEAEKAAINARSLTKQLVTFSRGGSPVKELIELCPLIDETVRIFLCGSKVSLNTTYPGFPVFVEADAGQLRQVFQNLTINACQAMGQSGTLTIHCTVHPMDKDTGTAGQICISVSDTGPGISLEDRDRIFDPYFTTKRDGMGLGLATVYSIVTKHNGRVEVCSEPGSGAEFRIYLPASEKAKASQQPKTAASGKKGRVLVVDDDPSVRKLLTSLLCSFGYAVDSAADGEQGLLMYQKSIQCEKYVLVFTDLVIIGGMGGKEFAANLKRIDPNALIIISSGYSDDTILAHYTEYGFAGAIQKPYTVQELRNAIQKALCQQHVKS